MGSDDAILDVTPEVLQSPRLKHPLDPWDSLVPTIPADNIAALCDHNKIMRSIRSYSGVCFGGIDGHRPAHPLDLVSYSTADAGIRLRQSKNQFDEHNPERRYLRLRRETPTFSE